MTEGIKKTKGNAPIYGGTFGKIYMAIFPNTNARNTKYFIINFSKLVGAGRFASLPTRALELANLQLALDAAKKWLRDK